MPFFTIVDDYFHKKILSKIGYKFESDGLDDFDVQAIAVIASHCATLEENDYKSKG